MEHAECGVDRRELHDRRLERHPEDAAREGLFDRFAAPGHLVRDQDSGRGGDHIHDADERDRKSTRLNSSHSQISYAVFCLKKKHVLTATENTTAMNNT